ncbi:MAG: glycosyltransferase [Phycisphaerales bacterium]
MNGQPAISKPAITTLMAVDRPGPGLAAAVASMYAQELRPDEFLIVLNPVAPSSLHSLRSALDHAILPAVPAFNAPRLIEAPGRNLAAALNLGLSEARHDLIARHDADDESLPARLAAQAAFLERHPEIAVVGTGFERIDDRGVTLERTDAANGLVTDPRELRWRLLISNQIAHGSVMVRRDAVLAVGGYDETCERAQDYDLWLRLAARGPVIANLPEVHYRYRCEPASKVRGEWAPSAAQAEVGARALSRSWDALPSVSPDAELESLIAGVISGDPGAAWGIENLLTQHGPTRERLRAYLWSKSLRGHTPTAVIEAGRLALLRQAGASLRSRGVRSVWIWGAGRHTGWLLTHAHELGLNIVGIVDDHIHGTHRHGFDVRHPTEFDDSCDVLLSSDAHEDALWAASASARARGVRVHRLYGGAGFTTVPTPHAAPVAVGEAA